MLKFLQNSEKTYAIMSYGSLVFEIPAGLKITCMDI